MPDLLVRSVPWMMAAVAMVVAYFEAASQTAFVRIAAAVVLLTAGISLLERKRWREALTKSETERLTWHGAWSAEKENADQLERVLQLGAHVGNATDLPELRRAINDALPPIAGTRDIWLAARVGGWQEVFRDAEGESSAMPTAWETFPLKAGGKALGVLGIGQGRGPLNTHERTLMTYAASAVAVALKNVQLFESIRQHSTIDSLTGCATRKYGLDVLQRELHRAARAGSPLSIVMIDVDYFKAINDTNGHLCGDAVLRHTGALLKASLRTTDLACRYGGEEFLIVLPETPTGGAVALAETLRQSIMGGIVACPGGNVRITVSCGVATAVAAETDMNALIGRADTALYAAKSAGRNIVQVDGGATRTPHPARASAAAVHVEPPAPSPSKTERRVRPWGRRSTDVSRNFRDITPPTHG